jgi:hypothetical protein
MERGRVNYPHISYDFDSIGGVMVCVFASSAVDREFEPRSGQSKDVKIGMCCLSAKHTALGRKSNDWLARILPSDCCLSELAL